LSTINSNYLNLGNFVFDLKRLPTVSFMIKSATLPALDSTPAFVSNPFNNFPLPGDHMNYSPFTITFFVDEEMTNYKEVFYWMNGLYFPRKWSEYQTLSSLDRTPGLGQGITSDASLAILNSNKKVINTLQFKNAYPTNMSSISYTYENEMTTYATVDVTFAYQDFDFS
jgi:hypothetical protein